MPKANTATLYLDNAIAEVVANKKLYVKNPDKDFTRERKLPMEALIYSIIEMKGNSLTGEMIKICEKLNTPLPNQLLFNSETSLKAMRFCQFFIPLTKDVIIAIAIGAIDYSRLTEVMLIFGLMRGILVSITAATDIFSKFT